MKIYELIKETLFRKTFIRVVHISWIAVYGLLFLIPVPPEAWKVWPWGPMLFGWSGCFLALIISAGIIGDDIASGRISLLITRPIWPGELYIYRLAGLSLQALLHLIIAGSLILLLLTVTGGSIENLDQWAAQYEDSGLMQGMGSVKYIALWILSAWLVFNTWAALATTLSTVVKRAHNSMLLFAAICFIYLIVMIMKGLLPEHIATETVMAFAKYACPPIELLGKFASRQYDLIHSLGCVIHSLALTAIYAAIGIIILCRRQFVFVRD